MPLLFKEEKGFGRLRKQFDDPVVVCTDKMFRFPPFPQRKCPDGTVKSQDCVTPTTITGNNNDPQWDLEMLKHCFVGEDPVTHLVKPVTEYASRAAFMAEVVGVLDDVRRYEQEYTTAYRKAVIRLWLDTPATYGVNTLVGLDVDPATGKLHLFRGELNVPLAEAIGRPVHASIEPRNFVDVLFSL